MAYKPTLGDIAGRVNRSGVMTDASGWAGLGKTLMASQAAQSTAALETASALFKQKGDMLENRFNEAGKSIIEFDKALAADQSLADDEAWNAMYQQAQGNRQMAELDLLKHHRMDVSASTQQKLATVINEIFTSEKEKFPDVDLREHLTWDDNWATLIKKKIPDVDEQLLEWAWKGKLIGLPSSQRERGGFFDWPGGVGGWVSEAAGTPMDVVSGIANFFLNEEDKIKNIPGGRMWMRENLGTTLGDITGAGMDVIRGKEARDLPSFWGGGKDPALQQMEREAVRNRKLTQQISIQDVMDTGSGIFPSAVASPTDVAGETVRANLSDIVNAPLIGDDTGLINGFLSREDESELPDLLAALSRDARQFLQKLSEYMRRYGPEEAQRLLSREFRDLKKSDKQNLEEYLTKSEAFA